MFTRSSDFLYANLHARAWTAVGLGLALLAPAWQARATPNEPTIAIDSGGSSAQGWYATDGSVTGGTMQTVPSGTTINIGSVYYPAPQAAYQNYRRGASTYTFTGLAPTKRYTVRLHFADHESTAVGARRFNVVINNNTTTPALSNYDIFADVGRNVAVIKPFNVAATASGTITVALTAVTGGGQPLISAIDVLPGSSYFINAGSTSMAGSYQADQFASGGGLFSTTSAIDTALVDEPAPQAVYKSERFHSSGNITYTLPNLEPGQRYDVRVHFAEISPNHNGIGLRKFHVKANNQRVLANFDPFEAAGGLYIATARMFEATANTNGNIVLLFERVVSNPTISAIEVRPQIAFKFHVGGSATGSFDADRTGYLATTGSTTRLATTVLVEDPAFCGVPIPKPFGPSALYLSGREGPLKGKLGYTLAGLIPDKMYRIRLHFSEMVSANNANGKRVFDIKVNDHIVTRDFDIFKVAGAATRKAVVHEVYFSANTDGKLEILLDASVGKPLLNGIEVERDEAVAGYFASDVGLQKRLGGGFLPSTVWGNDGGSSVKLGNDVLWAYGDTFFSDNVTGNDARAWTNTGALSSRVDLTHVLEVTDQSGGPAGQLVPWNIGQHFYNETHHAAFGCSGTYCDGTYYAIWPGSMVQQLDGSGLIFAGVGLIFGGPDTPRDGEGVVTYVQQPGVWPTNPTLPFPQMLPILFPADERIFTRGFVDTHAAPDPTDGHYIYLYRSETGKLATLSAAPFMGLTGNMYLPLYQAPKVGENWGYALNESVMPDQLIELITGTGPNAVREVVRVLNGVARGPMSNGMIELDVGKVSPAHGFGTVVQQIGASLGVLDVALSGNGTSVNQLTLINGLPITLKVGQQIEFWTDDANDNQVLIVATMREDAPKGTKILKVQPFTPTVPYSRLFTVVHQALPAIGECGTWNATYLARVPRAQATDRTKYKFWRQSVNNFAGGWTSNIGQGTPLPYADGSISWMDAPDVQWNEHLGAYLIVRTTQIGQSVHVATSPTPWGPWSYEQPVVHAHTSESYAGAYFMNQHPATALGNGQTIHVTYAASGPGPQDYTGGVRVMRLMLP